MSMKFNQQRRSLAQRAGRHEATKKQASVYLPMLRAQAQEHVARLFPERGRKTNAKMARLVQSFPER